MGDDDHGGVALVEHGLQPADRVDVQVVGRFVQQQHVRVREQCLCQQHAQLPARGHAAHVALVLGGGDAHAQQQLAGAGLGGVTVVFGVLGLQLGGLHVVFVGRFRVGVDGVALLRRAPHLGVAHHHHVQHAHVFIGELVLAQLAQAHARLQHDVARRRLEVAAQDLHEGGLAATVRADQAVAVALAELDRDILEQRLGAELHGDVCGRKHVLNLVWRLWRRGAGRGLPVLHTRRTPCRRGTGLAGDASRWPEVFRQPWLAMRHGPRPVHVRTRQEVRK